MLTVWILGEDFFRNLRGIADPSRVDSTHPDDILLLWFDTIINPELKLLDGSVVDSQPLQLRTGLCHLHMVASDRAAAILDWRLPGDIDVLSAGVRDSHFLRRRWSTWREKRTPRFTTEIFSYSLYCTHYYERSTFIRRMLHKHIYISLLL